MMSSPAPEHCLTDLLARLQAALADRYTIERELGRGGMATVYLAQDLKHDRSVALKVLRAELAALLGPERFLREIRVTARLQHPHILTLIDSGAADRFLYYVMPYVEGESLRQYLERERQLPLEESLRITRAVAAALEFAHRQGIIHRDIKPENILLHQGEPMVADFGIALAVNSAGRERLTETGLSLGTPAYMSPEQSAADVKLDGRSDQYSLASVLYEMLAGEAPYTGPTAQAIIAKRLIEPIPRLGTVRDVPRAVETAITKALAKAPADRFATTAEFVKALTSGIAVAPRVRRPRTVVLIALALLVVVASGTWGLRRNARTRWARERLVPQIGQLVEQRQHVAAFRLAREAEQYIPGDPVLKKVEDGFLLAATIRTTPPGAAVYMKEYTDVDGNWEYLGQTPMDTARLPFAYLHWKFTKDGHDPVEGATMIGNIAFTLEPVGSVPPDMVRVPAGTVQLGSRPPAKLDDFLMDKYEVTNRQFKKFVDGGGYRNAAYWKEPFVKNGRALSREEVVAGFRDKTDRPGPATWEAGGYPQGQDDFPVSGVSWYEAAAYAEFVGEALPTVYHWRRAAATEDLIYADILKLSNFAGKGAARVGSYPGLGPFGTYDMAGNVKEWCLNAVGDRRYILGGAWNEPEYMYLDEDARSPFDRSADNGFRLVKYLAAGPLAATLRRPIKQLTLDVRGQKPVSDEAFGVYRSLYAYDRGLLDPKVESVDETPPYWRQERITFNAAYGHERVIAYLLLPKGVAPPYQTIIYFPHSGALVRPAIEHADMLLIDFLVKSGRALLFPVYKDTYERLTQPLAPGMNAYRDEVVLAAKDFGRSLDYLETRPDVDRNRLGFYGLSWGAGVGPIVSAIDHRVKVAVLVGGGCEYGVPPEIDPINFAPRVKIPVLMINGRYDFTEPLETCQKPVFRLLGSPSGAKKHLVFDGGHVPPWIPTFRETLNWFDRFLGPVK